MKKTLGQLKRKVCIYSENNIIYKVNEALFEMTGYNEDYVLGKSLEDLSILLKNHRQASLEKIDKTSKLFIFNNEDKPIDIIVTCESLNDQNQKVHYLEENPRSSLGWVMYNFENMDIENKGAVAIYSYPECILLKSNKGYSEALNLMGLRKDEIIGEIPPFPDTILNDIKSGTSSNKEEVKIIKLNGDMTYWNIEIRPVYGPEKRKYLITSFYDRTKEVKDRNEINKQKTEMETILDNISDSIIKINSKGRFTYVNKAAKEKLAYYNPDVTSIDHKQMHTFFKRSDINGNEITFEESPEMRVLRGEKLTNYVTIGTSERPTTYHECNATPVYDELGNVVGGILIFKDIEDNFKIEEYNALRDNVKELSLSYGAFSYTDFKINYINEAGFNAVKKYYPVTKSKGDVIGKDFFEFYASKEDKLDVIRGIKEAIKNKSIYSHKKKFVKDGSERYVKAIFQPVFSQNGRVGTIVAVGMDITDEELANKQMSKALKLQDEIFINTSHELKTPLSLIFSASQLLNMYLEELEINTKQKALKSTKIIMQNCYRLTKLTNNILDISKMELGFAELNLENYNIIDILKSIVSSVSQYTNASGQEIIIITDVDYLIMAVDIYKFERVLLNLISNAIKFSNLNGLIVVELVKQEKTIEISIKDNGIGIDTKDFDKIFNKFTQLNTSLNRISEGTGIGLSLVKSVVNLHGGTIKVESQVGKGSKFIIELPIRTVDDADTNQHKFCSLNQLETIKLELSDIYS